MKIAIHKHSKGFGKRWVAFCEENHIPYKIVDCYQSDIISQLEDCDALMWHFYHNEYRDMLFARQLLWSLQVAGKRVFPDYNTSWHFDDKVGQKYLLEAIGAPLVPSHVFYTKAEAIEWINKTDFPKVFKLRGGAGAENVKLIKSKKEAIRLANKAFGRGFSKFNRRGYLKERIRKYKEGKDNITGVLKGAARILIPTILARMSSVEKGYVYFQDFIPDNTYDIRIIVVARKAFAIKRMNRTNDFRASGSGNIVYAKNQMDERCVRIAFDVNEKIKSQSIAYDFVFDKENNPLLVEISYGFSTIVYDSCEGYWNKDMTWHEGKFNPYGWMINDLLDRKNETI